MMVRELDLRMVLRALGLLCLITVVPAAHDDITNHHVSVTRAEMTAQHSIGTMEETCHPISHCHGDKVPPLGICPVVGYDMCKSVLSDLRTFAVSEIKQCH